MIIRFLRSINPGFSPKRINFLALLLAVAWTILINGSLVWNYLEHKKQIIELSRAKAYMAFDRDRLFRRWVGRQGGIYVAVTDAIQPNSLLAHIAERDITSPSGKKLTLLNPALLARKVFESADKDEPSGIGHLTSQNPIRPENRPDAWEEKALFAFDQGEKEVSEIQRIDGKDYIRLIRVSITEKPCLTCHAVQGYKEGDIRGGLSVTVPVGDIYRTLQPTMISSAVAHISIWLCGLGLIGIGSRKLATDMQEKEKLIRELGNALENVKVLRGFLPICAQCKKIRDDKGYWNQIESYISQHSEALFSHGICPECAAKLYSKLDLNPGNEKDE